MIALSARAVTRDMTSWPEIPGGVGRAARATPQDRTCDPAAGDRRADAGDGFAPVFVVDAEKG